MAAVAALSASTAAASADAPASAARAANRLRHLCGRDITFSRPPLAKQFSRQTVVRIGPLCHRHFSDLPFHGVQFRGLPTHRQSGVKGDRTRLKVEFLVGAAAEGLAMSPPVLPTISRPARNHSAGAQAVPCGHSCIKQRPSRLRTGDYCLASQAPRDRASRTAWARVPGVNGFWSKLSPSTRPCGSSAADV
jgi:hypothetical protein